LSPDSVLKLYENRIVLNQDDIEFADYAWQLYCSNNPVRIAQLSNYEDFNFPYLKQAFELHLSRFPSLKNGLNVPEINLLKTAQLKTLDNEKALVSKVLKNQGNFGFGDTQYFKILDTLKPLFASLEPVKLKRNATKILNSQTNYYSKIKQDGLYLGGALKYAYLYDIDQNTFFKL